MKLPFLATQVLTRRAAVHYESAFEDYLRTHAVPYVVADQTHRVMLANARVKGFDFLIHGGRGVNYIVDVKGRKVPDSHPGKPLAGPNWVTRDDVASLADWQRIFGASYTAMFVFAWWVSAPRGPYSAPAVSAAKPANLSGPIAPSRPPADLTHEYEGSYYCFRAIALDHYQLGLRRRSARWNTVHVSRQLFSEYSRPLGDLLGI